MFLKLNNPYYLNMLDYDRYWDEACDLLERHYQAVTELGFDSNEAKQLNVAFEQSLFIFNLLRAAQ